MCDSKGAGGKGGTLLQRESPLPSFFPSPWGFRPKRNGKGPNQVFFEKTLYSAKGTESLFRISQKKPFKREKLAQFLPPQKTQRHPCKWRNTHHLITIVFNQRKITLFAADTSWIIGWELSLLAPKRNPPPLLCIMCVCAHWQRIGNGGGIGGGGPWNLRTWEETRKTRIEFVQRPVGIGFTYERAQQDSTPVREYKKSKWNTN